MIKNIIVSIVGPDKPGVVSNISKIIKNNSGNIDKSRMVRLGDFFTIMVSITINKDNLIRLNKDLENYSDYQITTYESKTNLTNDVNDDVKIIHLNGIDNEGLVFKITNEFTKLNINIEELETNISNAPMSGLTLFSLIAKIKHPKIDYDILKNKMDTLSSELDVNIVLED